MLLILINFLLLTSLVSCKKFAEKEKPEWAKKDIRDFSDADMERLLDQWEVNGNLHPQNIKHDFYFVVGR